ncbi:hypothetical protein [Kitasatospora sp. CB01950]|uniref:hypothetical protein n=1 Tax=Kitasatospora sp. CB01950 TaxID=1703930 RepID=UPI00093E3FC8|nr:hypothetical protein [Kitasatospora sp. CB01950]OKI99260.1 hypothetical protein AMK19_31425 [Kitasatospora sp. CB01950]
MPKLNEARQSVLRRLYDMHHRGSQDVQRLEVLDTALSLTLGERRTADCPKFLLRNVLRDAKRTRDRAEMVARESAAVLPLPDARRRRTYQLQVDGTETVELVSHDTPEERALVSETLRELESYAGRLGRHGLICWSGLLGGRTVAETAAGAGVSTATVERAWKSIRGHARHLLVVAK